MRLDEYASHDALGLMALLKLRQVSAAELRACAVEAIHRTNPNLNFMAGAVDAAAWQPDRPFSGLPFLLKEGHGRSGGALAMGSRLCGGLKAAQDNEMTRRLRQAGVQFLGETTAPEFGIYPVTESARHGVTRNPWNLDHSPGGSSGGSSAAVAAGVVPVAQSSDGGGSIRGPAHCCGIYGLKPSRGRTPVPQRGLFGFTHLHVSTRTVRDSAAFLDQLHGDAAGALCRMRAPERRYLEEIARPPGRLRIAVMRRSPGSVTLSAECARAIDHAAKLAEALGHHVEEAAPRIDWNQLIERFLPAWFHPLPFMIRQYSDLAGQPPGPETLDAMTLKCLNYARHIGVDDLVDAETRFQAVRVAVDTFFMDYDVWMTPAGVSQAPRIGQFDPRNGGEDAGAYALRVLNEYALFTPLLNITGHPAASIPLHHGANGLPAGVQLVGAAGDDAAVLRLSAQLEAVAPWLQRHPPHSIFAPTVQEQPRHE